MVGNSSNKDQITISYLNGYLVFTNHTLYSIHGSTNLKGPYLLELYETQFIKSPKKN